MSPEITEVKRPEARPRSGPRPDPAAERGELLADVAEMYFLEGKTQDQIGRRVGVTRSMVSRMLSEARAAGIVAFSVRRPLSLDEAAADRLRKRFGLRQAQVVVGRAEDAERRMRRLGAAGAQVLGGYLRPGLKLGLTWGTAVRATLQALEVEARLPSLKIVQLIGAFGARIEDYDGHALVRALESRLGGEAYYIHAPFLVDSREAAQELLANRRVAETIALARQCDVALLGVGSVDPQHSSFYKSGYVPLRELKALQREGAVGDVCGLHFTAQGRPAGADFSSRLVGISERQLRAIPVRIGVAGGLGKAAPILGALRGGYLNVLVTDDLVAGILLKGDE